MARGPTVDRAHPARLGTEALDAAVVIDVLRATTTASVILARGVRLLWVVPEVAALRKRPDSVVGELLVFSELDEAAEFADRVDNSPVVASQTALSGRVPVLVTTNGTLALRAAADRATGPVLIASFVNLRAVAAWLRRRSPARVTLLPAGRFDAAETRTEDELCADALESLLSGGAPDLEQLFTTVREDGRVRRRIAAHPTFESDVALALSADRHPLVAGVLSAETRVDSSWLPVGVLSE